MKAEIDQIVTEMLKDLCRINTFIGSDGDVFDVDEDQTNINLADDSELCVGIKLVDERVSIDVVNWHSHVVCLSGLVLRTSFEATYVANDTRGIIVSAMTQGGVGARYLFQALGKKAVQVELGVKYSDLHKANLDDGYHNAFGINSAALQYLDETESEIAQIYENLKEQNYAFQKQLTLSRTMGSYRNFHKKTDLKEDQFYKPFIVNENFDKLFDEG